MTAEGAPRRAMLLSAGLGTRLRPLTLEVPKPLVWLGDRPQIDHALAELARGGIERAVINTHHLAHAFDDAWAARQPLEVVRVHEERILGTAGGIARAEDPLGKGTVLVWNADIVATLDVVALARAHAASAAGVTLVVGKDRLTPRQGTLGLTDEGAVVRLRTQCGPGERRGAMYAGIALLGPELRARLPSEGCLVGDVLMPWLAEGRVVSTFALSAPFHDVGSTSAYLDANLAWLAERGLEAWVADDARVVAGVAIERSIVGAGATVDGTGSVTRTVVWPGARAVAPLEDAVVTARGVVRLNPRG